MPYDRSPIYVSPPQRHKDMTPTKETKKASDENENDWHPIQPPFHRTLRTPPYSASDFSFTACATDYPPYIILFGLLFFIPTSRTMDSTFYYPNDNRIESHWTSFDLTLIKSDYPVYPYPTISRSFMLHASRSVFTAWTLPLRPL